MLVDGNTENLNQTKWKSLREYFWFIKAKILLLFKGFYENYGSDDYEREISFWE